MDTNEQIVGDWETLTHFLPDGWREQAKALGALQRCREIRDPEVLLRIFMIHLAQGYSLKETAVRAKASGIATVSSVAIHKRFRCSGEWLRWMAEGLLKGSVKAPQGSGAGLRVRMVDATVISERGSTGSDWRVHYALQLMPLRCDYFALTDIHGGESLTRVPVGRGDLVLGDRLYATAKGVAHVVDHGGQVLVRMRLNSFILRGPHQRRFHLLSRLRKLRVGQVGEWPVLVVGEGGRLIAGRICALRRSQAATAIELERLRKKYIRQRGKLPGPKAVEGARYVCVFTTVDGSLLSAADVMELYRGRWQIELAFKRMKSIFDFGHLPKSDPESSRAWLLGKLLVALLAEAIVESAHSFSPWGYVKISAETAASVCG
jgi:hypothetical protein